MDLSKMPWLLTLSPHPSLTRVDGWPDYQVGGMTLLQAAGNLDQRVLVETGQWLSADPFFFCMLSKVAEGGIAVSQYSPGDPDNSFTLKVLRRPTTPGHA